MNRNYDFRTLTAEELEKMRREINRELALKNLDPKVVGHVLFNQTLDWFKSVNKIAIDERNYVITFTQKISTYRYTEDGELSTDKEDEIYNAKINGKPLETDDISDIISEIQEILDECLDENEDDEAIRKEFEQTTDWIETICNDTDTSYNGLYEAFQEIVLWEKKIHE